jgi:hypothetical protein
MPLKKRLIETGLSFFLFVVTGICLVFAPAASANPSLLRQSIIDYNLESYKESLSDGTYKGAAGILLMGPEVARSFGLKAFINQDYMEARELNNSGKLLFARAVSAITTRKKEGVSGEHSKRAGKLALESKEALGLSRKHFEAYRSKLTPGVDDRLNRATCSALLDNLLGKSVKMAAFNLRDALGIFHNRCQGLPENSPALSPKNVRFVNYVFHEFTQKASRTDKERFDLGKQERCRGTNPGPLWKNVIRKEGPLFISLVEKCLDKQKGAGYPVDPLLFIALIKRESNFDAKAVSYVGAAGLTQIMPKTGKGLGMKNIYMPLYFEEAISLMARQRKLRKRAKVLLSEVTATNKTKLAKDARGLMQKSLKCGRERSKLFKRYKRDLLKKDRDDRLNPGKSIEFGYKYFSGLMKAQNGDISLALASYNAGPHRVKQYNGIPPYKETVSFRNMVLKYYWEYLNKTE